MQSLSKGEWIRRIIERAGITGHAEDTPYFMNVGAQSEYFHDVQAAVEWHILDPSCPFEPDELLNNDWTAFTLVNLCADLPEGNPSAVRDISKSQFAAQAASAVASGLMKTDARGMFRPKQIIDRDTAYEALDHVIEYINSRHFENEFALEWKDDLNVFECDPLAVDEETMSAPVNESFEAEPGDIVTYRQGLDHHAYKVTSRDADSVKLEEYDLADAVESLELSGSVKVNFDEAEIYDGSGNLIQPRQTGDHQNDHIHLMGNRQKTYEFEIHGFDVKVKTNEGSFNVDAEKKLSGGRIYATLGLNGVTADYSFRKLFTDIKQTYWHMSFDTSETLGIEGSSKTSKVMDFSRIDRDHFIGSLKNMMQNKEDAVQAELPIAKIAVPLGGTTICDLLLDVNLVLKTSGRAELVLSQHYNLGYDFQDGHFRTIKEYENKENISLKAETSLNTNLRTEVRTVGINVMDAVVNAGIRAAVNTKVHLYDDEGQMSTYDVDASADLADEMSAEVDDVLVCADVSGNWLLDLSMFSNDSLVGKFVEPVKVSILNESNAPLFPGGKRHFENWQAVDACTRKSRPKSEEREVMDTKGKISLEQYSIAVHRGETRALSILGLPAGYSLSDLRISSSDPSVASVSGLNVSGIASGSAIITIATADGSFSTSCNVLVPQDHNS